MLKKLVLSVFFLVPSLIGMAQVQRPKLVVGLVIDQMRWDYLYYYYDQFGQGGLKRLINEGYSCQNTMINYVPTVTAIGHSSIYTGSVPALTGIAGNSFYMDGKSVNCVGDGQVKAIGSDSNAGKASPKNLLASGIGDVLKVATDFKSKVIGIALKDRAAILPAGHGADAAYWWDTSAGHFITSSYYMNELPDWVKQFNKDNQQTPGKDVKTSSLGVALTLKMAEAALDNEKMGQDDVTDLLAVSISSTDAIGHSYGTRGKENHEVYMELDKDLEHFLNKLDEKVGRGNYLLFLSADHGAIHNYNFLNNHHIPEFSFSLGSEVKSFNKQFSASHGFNAVLGSDANRLYLNNSEIEKSGMKVEDVKEQLAAHLYKNSRVYRVVDYENIANEPIPQRIKERIVNGYNPQRSGDMYVLLKSSTVSSSVSPTYKGTTHGEWNPYDSHIPLIFMGWNVNHGETFKPTYIVDIAPTVCALLHIQMPNSCIGNPIVGVADLK